MPKRSPDVGDIVWENSLAGRKQHCTHFCPICVQLNRQIFLFREDNNKYNGALFVCIFFIPFTITIYDKLLMISSVLDVSQEARCTQQGSGDSMESS